MKNIGEVLKQKEAELQRVQTEVEALRLAIQLLSEDGDNAVRSLATIGVSSEFRGKEMKMVSGATREFP